MSLPIQAQSINFHLLQQCNARCGFCFFSLGKSTQNALPNAILSKTEHLLILEKITEAGFKKITFVGGEPLLCPWINDLFKAAKNMGMTTMLGTNGFLLQKHITENGIEDLDWITLSVDSVRKETNQAIGRCHMNQCWGEEEYFSLIRLIRSINKRLKINTVENRLNYREDFSDFIRFTRPERWKLLQVLKINDQNDQAVTDYCVSAEEFLMFINRHRQVDEITKIVPENNTAMTNSYIMIDPNGRLFQNTGGQYHYSKNTLIQTNFESAFREIEFDLRKYIDRNAAYNW